MPLDLDALSASARADFIRVGRRFGSADTLAQANQTLNALAVHGAALAEAGFSAADAELLEEARDALLAAGVGREASRTARKETSQVYLRALRAAKDVRLRARAILERAAELVDERDDAEARAAVEALRAELARTSATPDDAEGLATQLLSLRAALEPPLVAEVTASRGGPKAREDASANAAALRALAKERTVAPGTPAETERLDLLDGIVVKLTRAARRAARSAAKETAKPALLTGFELAQLYGRRGEIDAPAPATAPGETV